MQQPFFARGIQRLALGALGALVSLASAQAANTDTAEIRLTANGVEQRIEVDMNALAPGESRQLVASSGLPAIVTRTDDGLRVEIAGVVREIPMAPVELQLSDLDGDARHVMIKRKHVASEGDAEQRHEVKVIRRSASAGEIDEAELDALVADALEEAGEGEPGSDKVRVIRRIERHQHEGSEG